MSYYDDGDYDDIKSVDDDDVYDGGGDAVEEDISVYDDDEIDANNEKQIINGGGDDDDDDDVNFMVVDEEDDDDESVGEQGDCLEKIKHELYTNKLTTAHPEHISVNFDEVLKLSTVVRNDDGIIIDHLHRTLPFITKYERTRIIGQRAIQIQDGAMAYVEIPADVIDPHIIANMEFIEKKIPVIVCRPMSNGATEYWKLADLEQI